MEDAPQEHPAPARKRARVRTSLKPGAAYGPAQAAAPLKMDPEECGEMCIICYGALPEGDSRPAGKLTRKQRYAMDSALRAVCCGVRGHRGCLQRMADEAGQHFRCPCCKNEEDFVRNMHEGGVTIHKGSHSWKGHDETLMVSNVECSAETCSCPFGRGHRDASNGRRQGQSPTPEPGGSDGAEGASSTPSRTLPQRAGLGRALKRIESLPEWYMFTCGQCGSAGSHKACVSRTSIVEHGEGVSWMCGDCEQLRRAPR